MNISLKPPLCLCSVILSTMTMIHSPAQEAVGSPMKIILIGDSTVADYKTENVMRGWGQELHLFLKPSIEIVNLASPGKSTKTYFDSGAWAKALGEKADFILIQFGHNDSHAKTKPESTDADTVYSDNLRRYVKEAREAGSVPILVTPMHRLRFDPKTGKLTTELEIYANAMKRVAAEMKTPLIDLYVESGKTFEPMGNEGVAGLTVSDADRTHFTEKGARIVAELVAREATKADPRLAAAVQ